MADTRVSCRVTYLERTAPPGPPAELPANVTLQQVPDMPVATYRALYREVGEPWLWWERLPLTDDELETLLRAETTEIYVLAVAGVPAGFAELDRSDATAPRIRYLGLKPDHIGQGLGGVFFDAVLHRAWAGPAERVVLDTCEYDHPGALGFYQRHGFRIVRTDTETWDDPRLVGLMPLNAAPHRPPRIARGRGRE